MSKLRVLITGGCSFAGSNYINYSLERKTYKIIINIDILQYPGTEANIRDPCDGSYILVRGDMGDTEIVYDLLTKYEIDTVIHFGGYSHVDQSFIEPMSYLLNNTLGTGYLLEACRRYGKLKKFLHFSTDEVYGEVPLDHPGVREDSSYCPTNPYAASKAASDMLCNSYFYSYHLPLLTIHSNNIYGPNQQPEKLIPKFISLLKDSKKVTIHGKGEARRNFVHTEDISRAIDVVLEKGELGQSYNIGTDDEYSVLDIAHILIKDIKGADTNVDDWMVSVPDRAFNDCLYRVDTTKIRSLGWYPQCDFLSKLRELY